jgi:hypothetical protein
MEKIHLFLNEKEFLMKTGSKEYMMDLNKFTKMKFEVFKKYDDFEKVNLSLIGGKNFINALDRYILHTIEEVVEADDCFFENCKMFESDFVEELNDIIQYSGTIRSFLVENILYYNKKTGSSIEILENIKIIIDDNSILNHETLFMNVINKLSHIRMLFPERKWHKPSPELTEEMIGERLSSSIILLDRAIKSLITFLVIIYEDCGHINNLLYDKHDFVMNLDMVEKR